jgi:heme-degrading monooxygenase HmoA
MSEPESLIEGIRLRPEVYLGGKSLTAFHQFLGGYQMACSLHQIGDDRLGLRIPADFHEWVACRTRFRESTSGWCKMIVATSQSEEEAFDRFFELLAEHSERAPRVIAEIIGPTSTTRAERDGEDYLIPPPKKVQLVKYTADPGFFALHDNEDWRDRFHPYLTWLRGLSGGELVIHDEDAYNGIVRDTEQWELEVAESIKRNDSRGATAAAVGGALVADLGKSKNMATTTDSQIGGIPYYAVIFTSVRTDGDNGYGDTARRMVELASGMPGFLGVDSVRGSDGFGITVSYWRSEADIAHWREHAEHQVAQQGGRAGWYSEYTVRIAKVERAYGKSQ